MELHRRWLIYGAIAFMTISFFTGHIAAAMCVLVAIFLLVATIAMSVMRGCGAHWADWWLQ